MSQKWYNTIKLIIAMLIAIFVSIAVSLHNYYLPLAIALAGAALLYLLRRQVKGVLADERDYALAGTASRYTIFTISIIGLILVFILLDLGQSNSYYQTLGNLLAYFICAMMLINAIIFKFLNYKK